MKNRKTSSIPSFSKEGSIFLGANRSIEGCEIAIFGVPFDGTTSFRPGARFGPASIREVSLGLETFCPELNLDLEDLSFVDLGSLDIPFGAPEPVIQAVKETTKHLLSKKLKTLILGGEHSISSGAVDAIVADHPELILVQLDAHADLRQEWLGSCHSHACAMRRCLDVLPSKKIFQVAIRSGTRQEFEELIKKNQLIPHKHGEPAYFLEKALKPYQGKPIYLSIDLDWFDPSVMPGTGTPEPGGFIWQDFAAVLDVLKTHKVVAADIVELSPQLDPSNVSSILAAKVTRSVLMLLGLSNIKKNY